MDTTREGNISFKSKEPHTSLCTLEKSTNGRNSAGLPRGRQFLSFENGWIRLLASSIFRELTREKIGSEFQ
jgi:hypothetical protein